MSLSVVFVVAVASLSPLVLREVKWADRCLLWCQGEALVGLRAACWWRSDKRWFCGHIVAAREPGNGPVSAGGGGAFGAVRIRYDDGEALWEPLPPYAASPWPRSVQSLSVGLLWHRAKGASELVLRLQPSAAEHARLRMERRKRGGFPPAEDADSPQQGQEEGDRDGKEEDEEEEEEGRRMTRARRSTAAEEAEGKEPERDRAPAPAVRTFRNPLPMACWI